MKIFSIAILRYDEAMASSGNDVDPILLKQATDLSNFNFFQRGSVAQTTVFLSRTLVKRTAFGQRQGAQEADFRCWVHVRTDGIGACVITDEEYPSRVAFALMTKVMEDFVTLHRGAWNSVEKDTVMVAPSVDEAIVKFQDPAEADSLTRIQRELEATKVVLHKSIDSMLERGEKLDTLVEKSNDLNRQSKQFYKVAKKNNACCVIC